MHVVPLAVLFLRHSIPIVGWISALVYVHAEAILVKSARNIVFLLMLLLAMFVGCGRTSGTALQPALQKPPAGMRWR